MPIPRQLPVCIVTGFLGSGKTTLLRQALFHSELLDASLLVNEVAAVGVDDRLLDDAPQHVELIGNGCLCCTARPQFKDTLLRHVESEATSPHACLIIETSGLADPAPLLEDIAGHPRLVARSSLSGVITVVDCVHAARNHAEYAQFANQVAYADMLVLSKIDMVEATTVDAVVKLIRSINPHARLLRNDDPALDSEVAALACGRGKPALRPQQAIPPVSTEQLDSDLCTFSVVLGSDCDWTAFAVWLSLLIHAHGDSLLRIKGVLNVRGSAAPVSINCVRSTVHFPEHLAPDDRSQKKGGTLVFIVRRLRPEDVLCSLRRFLGRKDVDFGP